MSEINLRKTQSRMSSGSASFMHSHHTCPLVFIRFLILFPGLYPLSCIHGQWSQLCHRLIHSKTLACNFAVWKSTRIRGLCDWKEPLMLPPKKSLISSLGLLGSFESETLAQSPIYCCRLCRPQLLSCSLSLGSHVPLSCCAIVNTFPLFDTYNFTHFVLLLFSSFLLFLLILVFFTLIEIFKPSVCQQGTSKADCICHTLSKLLYGCYQCMRVTEWSSSPSSCWANFKAENMSAGNGWVLWKRAISAPHLTEWVKWRSPQDLQTREKIAYLQSETEWPSHNLILLAQWIVSHEAWHRLSCKDCKRSKTKTAKTHCSTVSPLPCVRRLSHSEVDSLQNAFKELLPYTLTSCTLFAPSFLFLG